MAVQPTILWDTFGNQTTANKTINNRLQGYVQFNIIGWTKHSVHN